MVDVLIDLVISGLVGLGHVGAKNVCSRLTLLLQGDVCKVSSNVGRDFMFDNLVLVVLVDEDDDPCCSDVLFFACSAVIRQGRSCGSGDAAMVMLVIR